MNLFTLSRICGGKKYNHSSDLEYAAAQQQQQQHSCYGDWGYAVATNNSSNNNTPVMGMPCDLECAAVARQVVDVIVE